ncbi:hypothetical protein [Streptomyces sp. NPDC029003]
MRTAFGGPIPALPDVWVDPRGRAVLVTPPAGEETEASDGCTGPAVG